MWFILALIALFMWSGSELFAKIGCQDKKDKSSHLKMVVTVGLVMGLHGLYSVFVEGIQFSLHTIWVYLPVSFLYILSMAIGYLGLRYIELSISTPICNSSGSMVVLIYLIQGERPAKEVLLAVFLITLGIIALGITEYKEDEAARMARQKSHNIKYHKSILAILIPILYCIIDALGTYGDTIALEYLNEREANVAYEFTFLAVGLVVFLYLLIKRKAEYQRKYDLPKLVSATFETAGQLAYIMALNKNKIGAAPLISSYCVLSILWGRIFLKEKLSFKHYLAIFYFF